MRGGKMISKFTFIMDNHNGVRDEKYYLSQSIM